MDHLVGCRGNGDRISRHNSILDVVLAAAQSASLAPSRSFWDDGGTWLSRPADMILLCWSCDCCSGHPCDQPSPATDSLAEASVSPGHALQIGVQCKLASNLPACGDDGVQYIPIVTETIVGLAEDTIHTIRHLGQVIADRTGSLDPSASAQHPFLRFAISPGGAMHALSPYSPSHFGWNRLTESVVVVFFAVFFFEVTQARPLYLPFPSVGNTKCLACKTVISQTLLAPGLTTRNTTYVWKGPSLEPVYTTTKHPFQLGSQSAMLVLVVMRIRVVVRIIVQTTK